MGDFKKALQGAAAALTLTALAMRADAGATDPTLAILRVASARGQAGRLVQIVGILPADDLVQRALPVGVLVHQGDRFARFDLAGGRWLGTAAALADGFDLADVPAVLAASLSAPDGGVVALGGDRVEVLLPAAFPSGTASVSLFLVDPAVLSNPARITVALP